MTKRLEFRIDEDRLMCLLSRTCFFLEELSADAQYDGDQQGGDASTEGEKPTKGQHAPKNRPAMKSSIGFVPRSVPRPKIAADGSAASTAPKSNDDFRKMLLKKSGGDAAN